MLSSPFRRRQRAMTFVELMVSVGLFTIVGVFVAALTVEIAQQSRDALVRIPAEDQAYRTMDYVRTRLMTAQLNSLAVSEDGTTIDFRNPSLTGMSRITFDEASRKVVFDPNINVSNDELRWGRGVRGRFDLVAGDVRRVSVRVSTTALNRKGETTTISYTEQVTIRN